VEAVLTTAGHTTRSTLDYQSPDRMRNRIMGDGNEIEIIGVGGAYYSADPDSPGRYKPDVGGKPEISSTEKAVPVLEGLKDAYAVAGEGSTYRFKLPPEVDGEDPPDGEATIRDGRLGTLTIVGGSGAQRFEGQYTFSHFDDVPVIELPPPDRIERLPIAPSCTPEDVVCIYRG
jgi:hypothetical protein